MGIFSRFKKTTDSQPAAVSAADPKSISLADIEASVRRRKVAHEAGHVRGKHYTEWVPALNTLRTAGEASEQKYLSMVLDIITAAEHEAAVLEQVPPDGYTKRAAIVYRRRKDYAGEVAVIERYFAACPPDKREHEELRNRLERVRQLGS